MTVCTIKHTPMRPKQEQNKFDDKLVFTPKAYIKKSNQSKLEQNIALMVFTQNIHRAKNLPNSKIEISGGGGCQADHKKSFTSWSCSSLLIT